MPSINDIYGVGVRQQMAFVRRREQQEVVVGRFTCILKLVVRLCGIHVTYNKGRLHDKISIF